MLLEFTVGGSVITFISLLLRDRGLAIYQISLIFTCASATLLVVPFFWGMLADRYIPLDRLFIMLNLVAAAALLALAFQHTFAGLFVTYLLFFVCYNPLLSLINALGFHHLPDPANQFGRLRSWGSVGWILPFFPISLCVSARGADLTFAIYLGATMAFGMAILSFFLPHTPPAHPTGPTSLTPSTYGPALRQLFRNTNFLVLLAAMFLVASSYSLMVYYSPPRLEALGVPRTWIGPAYAIGVVCEIALFQIQPAIIRRWRFRTMILVGCFALIIRHLLYASVDNAWVLALSYVLAGAVIVFFHIGVSMMVNAMVGREIRATAQTLLSLCGQGLGPTVCNFTAGALSARYHDRLEPIFWFATGLATAAVILIFARGNKLNPI
jgi:MFS family permease